MENTEARILRIGAVIEDRLNVVSKIAAVRDVMDQLPALIVDAVKNDSESHREAMEARFLSIEERIERDSSEFSRKIDGVSRQLLDHRDVVASIPGKTAEAVRSSIDHRAKVRRAADADEILDSCLRARGWLAAYRRDQLTDRQHMELLHEVRQYGRSWLWREARRFVRRYGPKPDGPAERALGDALRSHAGRFFGRVKGFMRELLIAGAMAVSGPTPLSGDDLAMVDRNHSVQVAYLDRFQADVIAEQQPMDGTFASRAEQYGASVWGDSQDTVRSRAARAGKYREESRLHIGIDEACDDCKVEIGRGWQPIGTLRRIGDTQCRSQCHCIFKFREGPGKPEVLIGKLRQ